MNVNTIKPNPNCDYCQACKRMVEIYAETDSKRHRKFMQNARLFLEFENKIKETAKLIKEDGKTMSDNQNLLGTYALLINALQVFESRKNHIVDDNKKRETFLNLVDCYDTSEFSDKKE